MGDGVIDGRGGEKMLGSQFSWWDLAGQARAGGAQQVPRLIVANGSNNFTLYRITIRNAPGANVVFNHGDGLNVWGLKIDVSRPLPSNTPAIDAGDGAKTVSITRSSIQVGGESVPIH